MAAPKTVDASVTNFYPARAVAIDASSADVDLTVLFTDGYARKLYIGTNSGTQAIKVTHLDGASVSYANIPQGTFLAGVFVSVQHTGTTVTNIVAEGN